MAERGTIFERYRGVFFVGRRLDNSKEEAMAAVKAAGEGAVLARRAAGALRNIPNMPRCPQIVISAEHGISLPGIKVIRSRILPPEDIASVHGIPATSGERTLLDLAEVFR
ncbi:MAG TPA: hypothetical protein VHA57_02585 [Actinomycetota bacterium]|nr:hypothetical protein [Actinomycetota bacterium]